MKFMYCGFLEVWEKEFSPSLQRSFSWSNNQLACDRLTGKNNYVKDRSCKWGRYAILNQGNGNRGPGFQQEEGSSQDNKKIKCIIVWFLPWTQIVTQIKFVSGNNSILWKTLQFEFCWETQVKLEPTGSWMPAAHGTHDCTCQRGTLGGGNGHILFCLLLLKQHLSAGVRERIFGCLAHWGWAIKGWDLEDIHQMELSNICEHSSYFVIFYIVN